MKLLFYSLLLLTITSCSIITEKATIKAEKYDSLEIPLGKSFLPETGKTQYFDTDSGEYLAIVNKGQNNVEIVNLTSRKWRKPIHLSREGPNGIGSHNGFRILAKDCLIVASIPPNLRILDFEGNLKKTISVRDPDNQINFLTSDNRLPFLLGDGVIYGAQPFFQNIFETTVDQVRKSKHLYKISLISGEESTEWLPVYRPKDEWENGKTSNLFNWTDRFDSILISPIADSRIWVISKKKGQLIGYKDAKSQYVTQYDYLDKIPSGDEGMIDDLINDRYELLLHDSYRDVFYRFFFIGVDDWQKFDMTVRNLFSNRPIVGVMILDKNLDILGEHVFENHEIEPWNYFVGRKGLYVSTNNPNRDDFDENVLRYDVIRFSGLKYEDK